MGKNNLSSIVSNALEIIRDIGTPEIIDSFDIIRDITVSLDGIIEALNSQEMAKNMDNIGLALAAIDSASAKIKRIQQELGQTGSGGRIESLVAVLHKSNSGPQGKDISLPGPNGSTLQNLAGVASDFKYMVDSVKSLAEEIQSASSAAKQSPDRT